MDDEPVVWDQHNRRHIIDDHPERAITFEEIEQAMKDSGRILGQEIREGIPTTL